MPRSKQQGRRIQSTQDILICKHCDYKARSEKGIKLHLKFSHSIEKNLKDEDDYRCENCGKIFDTDEYLIKHMKKVHRR